MNRPLSLGCYVSIGQGTFYIATGVWPLVHLASFLKVTGPKADLWLVKTVGVLITVIGLVLAVAGRRGQVTPETTLLAVGSAAGLAGIDTVYVARGRISLVYLLDAVLEAGLVLLWLWAHMSGKRSAKRR